MVSQKTTLIFCLVLLIASIPAVSAEILHPEMVTNKTMSYADLGLTGSQDIQIWVGNTLVETGNTSAGYLYQPDGDFTVVVKPTLSNRWLNNPALFLTDAMDYLLAFAFPLFIILGFAAIIIGLANMGRRR